MLFSIDEIRKFVNLDVRRFGKWKLGETWGANRGPDPTMEPEEFTQMVKDIRLIEKAMGSANYCISEAEKVNMNFRRSIFIVEDINAGDLFTEKNIRSIRPANGLHPRYLERIIGRTAKTNISRGVPLTWSHISD